MKRVLLLFASIAVFSGCASRIETVKVDPETLQVKGEGIEGVLFYEPKLVRIRYEFTQLVDKEKGVIGTSLSGTCTQVIQKEEVTTLPDYDNPKAVLHKPSWFSSAEFGVSLNKGMLVSVTAKSTPQTGPILEQIVKAKEASLLGAPAVGACNAGPVITEMESVKF